MALESGAHKRRDSGKPGILKSPMYDQNQNFKRKESKFGVFKNNNEDADQEQMREFIK